MSNNKGVSGAGAGTTCLSSLVDCGSVESQRYYLARRTVIEMLRDRGYAVSRADAELCGSIAEFRAAFGDKPNFECLRLLAHRATAPSRKILVIFAGTDDIRKQTISGILNQIMNTHTLDRLILILQSKMNSHAQKVANEYPVKVETFSITELLVNITKHVLEPKYEILAAEEKQKLLNKYSIEDKQLPRMLENDAIVRYYGLVKGQVVKVTYGGVITNSVVAYRCVM